MDEEVGACVSALEAAAKRAVTGTAASVVLLGSLAGQAEAYPIFAQQNYPNPVDGTGKIACANCHLATKPVDVRVPHEVIPDTIFKMVVEVPCKYEKRRQLSATGEKVELNVGAIVVMPEGYKLAPRERLPKALKKEMRGLSWSPYSKEKPNILVAGPVPGKTFERMVVPVLAPIPDGKTVFIGKELYLFGANRGRGQVYPEGNVSNNNVFLAKFAGTIKSIEGDSQKRVITLTKADGTDFTQEVLAGADVVVKVGDVVQKDQQLTTNPNVGGFGQEDRDIMLQDVNRIYAVQALMVSFFISQLAFVLKKKQFEKVQLAEGF